MTVRAQFKDYARNNPEYFMRAGDHVFTCECMDCVVFLVDGLYVNADCMTEDDLKKFNLVMSANEYTDEARQALRELFNAYL